MMLGTERPQRLRRLGARHAEMVPHENRRKRVPDVVPAEDPEVHLGAVGQREPGTPLGGDRRLCRDKIGVPVFQGVALDLDWAVAVQLPQALVVPVQHEEAVVRERLGELALRASHLIHRAQRSQMGGARVRQDPHVGGGKERELPDLAARAHAHLQHQHLVLGRKMGERQRNADVIVQVSPVLVHAVPRPEHGRDHLLGRGLAVRSGDRGDRNPGFPAAVASQRLKRAKGVLDRDDRLPAPAPCRIGGPGLRDEGARSLSLERRRHEIVPVCARPGERNEELPLRDRPRVDGAAAERRARRAIRRRVEQRSLGHAEDLLEREPGALVPAQRWNPLARSASRATSRSSKSRILSPMI